MNIVIKQREKAIQIKADMWQNAVDTNSVLGNVFLKDVLWLLSEVNMLRDQMQTRSSAFRQLLSLEERALNTIKE